MKHLRNSKIKKQRAINKLQDIVRIRDNYFIDIEAEKATNSIKASGHKIFHYNSIRGGGRLCSCRYKNTESPDSSNLSFDEEKNFSTEQYSFSDIGNSSFDVGHVENFPEDEELSNLMDTEYSLETGEKDIIENLYGGESSRCGICLRTGYNPPYRYSNGKREVFSHEDIYKPYSYNYFVDQSTKPFTIHKEIPQDSKIVFKFFVSPFIEILSYAVLDNTEPQKLKIKDYFSNAYIDAEFLNRNKNSYIYFYTDSSKFTHIVLETNYNSEDYYGAFPQLNREDDYSKFIALSNVSIITSNNLKDPKDNDIIYSPTLNLYFKITSIDPNINVDKKVLNYNLQTRILQPLEIGRLINHYTQKISLMQKKVISNRMVP